MTIFFICTALVIALFLMAGIFHSAGKADEAIEKIIMDKMEKESEPMNIQEVIYILKDGYTIHWLTNWTLAHKIIYLPRFSKFLYSEHAGCSIDEESFKSYHLEEQEVIDKIESLHGKKVLFIKTLTINGVIDGK